LDSQTIDIFRGKNSGPNLDQLIDS